MANHQKQSYHTNIIYTSVSFSNHFCLWNVQGDGNANICTYPCKSKKEEREEENDQQQEAVDGLSYSSEECTIERAEGPS